MPPDTAAFIANVILVTLLIVCVVYAFLVCRDHAKGHIK